MSAIAAAAIGAALAIAATGVVAADPEAARAASAPASFSRIEPVSAVAEKLYTQTVAAFVLDHRRSAAEQGFGRVTQLAPQFSPAWFNLGVLAEADEHWARASHYFCEYLRLTPHGPDAARARAQIPLLKTYAQLGRSRKPEADAKYDGMVQRARALLGMNLFRAAIAEAGEAQAADPTRWEAYAVVALCMAKQHKLSEAKKLAAIAVAHASPGIRERIEESIARQTAVWNP